MKFLSCWILLSLAVLAPPAEAQVEGSRLTKYVEKVDGERIFQIWVGCVAGLDRRWARGVLETVPTTSIENAAINKRMGYNDRCLEDSRLLMDNRELRMSAESVRGELGRFYVKNELAERPAPPAGSAPAMGWLRHSLAQLPADQAYDRAVLVGHQFAACLSDNYWNESRAVVLAERKSAAEKAALAVLSPQFSSCLAPGAKLNLTVPILRLYLAEALYHGLTFVAGTSLQVAPASGRDGNHHA